MDLAELGDRIYRACHLTGSFTLRSGQTSAEYFDKYLFESQPDLLASIAWELAPMIGPDIEILAGFETGGIPLATALSLQTGRKQVFVRKEAKKYGTCKLAEGVPFAGKRLCGVEDVVTTGGQIIDSVTELRKRGGTVVRVVCVILRNEKAYELLDAHGIQLRPLFTMQGDKLVPTPLGQRFLP